MKLLSLTIKKVDSTSFYRANGIFGDLKTKIPNLEINSLDVDVKNLKDMNWSDLNLYDVIFMQRPYSWLNLQLARFVNDMKIPLWIDYDDNLFAVPRGNRAYDVFSQQKTQQTIAQIAKLATTITVSTGELANVFKQISPNVEVIPNALNTRFLPPRPQKQENTVLWRGSDTHLLDMVMFLDEIAAIQEKYSKFTFTYFGYDNPFIPLTPNYNYIKSTDPILYCQQLAQIAPKIMQVPLVDGAFNRSKSNIAYLEGTYAGAVCLVPDWPEWQLPGTVRYKNETEYREKLELLLNDKINLKKYNTQAWEYITENLTLDKVNQQRADLLQRLYNYQPQPAEL